MARTRHFRRSRHLAHGFPTQLFEPFTDGDGNLSSRPVFRDGQPVHCRDAVERRDRIIERLASLAPVQGALDQIVQRFGTDMVAEITGRSGADHPDAEHAVRRVRRLARTRIEGAIASGTYDVGVETVTAESLKVTDRRTLYVHPQSGAETQVFTISRRDRNRPFTLAEALDVASDPHARLLVNAQSGRAAVQVPAPSLMLDDGEVERRVRLIRPTERPAIPLSAMAQTHWREADRTDFIRAWETELTAVPEFTDSSLHIVTGLPLPIWKRLPNDSMRVYRLQTDDGERIIGRLVSPAWVAQAVETETPALDPADAFAAVLDGRTILHLEDGLELRRVKVMGDFRIEVSGFTDGMVDRLKAMGLVSEIIAWKLRLFVPVRTDGPAILGALMERYPLVRIAERPSA